MNYQVDLTEGAALDLEEICNYVADHDSPEAADALLDNFEKTIATLATLPQRGAIPRELAHIGIKEYREVFFKPYRVIYRVYPNRVVVMFIADGRRDMQGVLGRRLLR